MSYNAESDFAEMMRERMEGDHLATPGEAHAEWHLNAGVPMGQPGCPQDACHLPDDLYYAECPIGAVDSEMAAHRGCAPKQFPSGPGCDVHGPQQGVRCGNHGWGNHVYHASSEEVKACYAEHPYQKPASLADPGTVSPAAPYGTTQVTLAPAPAAKPDRISVEEIQSWKAIPVGKGDHAFYALASAASGEVTCFRVRRPSVGKYQGRTYVDRQSGDNFSGMPFRESAQVLSTIARNPAAAAVLYGKSTNRCAMCHRSLSDNKNKGPDGLTSVERGIGPKCMKKAGW